MKRRFIHFGPLLTLLLLAGCFLKTPAYIGWYTFEDDGQTHGYADLKEFALSLAKDLDWDLVSLGPEHAFLVPKERSEDTPQIRICISPIAGSGLGLYRCDPREDASMKALHAAVRRFLAARGIRWTYEKANEYMNM
jgi:hypothetical protein